MTPLHYAKAIRTGLLMAAKARYEGGFRMAAMLDALARNDWRSAKSHWLMVELWVSQVDSINRLTLEMCKASRMPICGGETTRYEREEQVFSGGRSPDSDGSACEQGRESKPGPGVTQGVEEAGGRAKKGATPNGPHLADSHECGASRLQLRSTDQAGAIPADHPSTSPSYFPPVLRP